MWGAIIAEVGFLKGTLLSKRLLSCTELLVQVWLKESQGESLVSQMQSTLWEPAHLKGTGSHSALFQRHTLTPFRWKVHVKTLPYSATG